MSMSCYLLLNRVTVNNKWSMIQKRFQALPNISDQTLAAVTFLA